MLHRENKIKTYHTTSAADLLKDMVLRKRIWLLESA